MSTAAPQSCLLIVAAPSEARAVLRALSVDTSKADQLWALHPLTRTLDMVVSGIGKANAAGATSRFADALRHGRLLSIGVGGSLPGSGMTLGSVIAATTCVFADEGVQTPTGFLDCHAMGFPLGDFSGSSVPVDPGVLNWLRPQCDATGPIATVSTCSGTDSLATAVHTRTGAVVEAMEGAAVALVAQRLGIPCGELRVVSNTTGDRPNQQWNIRGALARLGAVIGRLAAAAP